MTEFSGLPLLAERIQLLMVEEFSIEMLNEMSSSMETRTASPLTTVFL